MCRHKKLMIKTILLITVTMIPCSLQLTKEEELSDKELDILLKDPKYVSLATDMLKTEEKSTEKHKGGNLSHKPSERKKGFNLDLFKALDSEPEGNTTAEKEKKEVEDRFKSFDFITKQQARYLLEILKQPVFFNMLPNEAKTIVKVN